MVFPSRSLPCLRTSPASDHAYETVRTLGFRDKLTNSNIRTNNSIQMARSITKPFQIDLTEAIWEAVQNAQAVVAGAID
jgi:hypothetical protein